MAEAGKKPHGNKKYYHVLIDINRGELFDDYIRTKLKNQTYLLDKRCCL